MTFVVDINSHPLPPTWRTLLDPEDMFISPDWLPIDPGGYAGPSKHAWLVGATDADHLIAGTVAYVFDRNNTDTFCRPDLFIGSLIQAYKGEQPHIELDQLSPSMLTGGWFNSRIAVHTSLDGARTRDACWGMLERLQRMAVESESRCLAFQFVRQDNELLNSVLTDFGFVRFPCPPRWQLVLPSKDYEDYLQAMSSNRRRQVLKEQAIIEAAGVVFSEETFDECLIDESNDMVIDHEAKFAERLAVDRHREWTRELMLCNALDTTSITARLDGRLIGIVVGIFWEGRYYALYSGFDTTVTAQLPLYFVICYYELVKHVLRRG